MTVFLNRARLLLVNVFRLCGQAFCDVCLRKLLCIGLQTPGDMNFLPEFHVIVQLPGKMLVMSISVGNNGKEGWKPNMF